MTKTARYSEDFGEIHAELIHIPQCIPPQPPVISDYEHPAQLRVLRGNGYVVINGVRRSYLQGQTLELPPQSRLEFVEAIQETVLLALPLSSVHIIG